MIKAMAQNKNLFFTGKYEKNKESIKEQKAQIQAEYPEAKFYIITESDVGYSVYGNKHYNLLKRIKETQQKLANYQHTFNYIKNEYELKLKELNDNHKQNEENLSKLSQELKELD